MRLMCNAYGVFEEVTNCACADDFKVWRMFVFGHGVAFRCCNSQKNQVKYSVICMYIRCCMRSQPVCQGIRKRWEQSRLFMRLENKIPLGTFYDPLYTPNREVLTLEWRSYMYNHQLLRLAVSWYIWKHMQQCKIRVSYCGKCINWSRSKCFGIELESIWAARGSDRHSEIEWAVSHMWGQRVFCIVLYADKSLVY